MHLFSFIHIIIALLFILAGFILSFYFYLVHDRGMDPEQWWMPKILRMTDCRCDEIVNTEFGLKFGYSNSFWGMGYYLLLFGIIIWNINTGFPPVEMIIVLVILAGCYSVYLIWALYLMRVLCRPCIGVHLINFALCILILSKTYSLLFIR
ncbi:MAG: vitamin K epoxide reductase family protein [Fidelibacterota bacterium]